MHATSKRPIRLALGSAIVLSFATAGSVFAYDGNHCKAPGNCWEPKPGYPATIAGSKYDPKHDAKEVAKQGNSLTAMEERNKKRVDHYKKTGKFVYELDKITE